MTRMNIGQAPTQQPFDMSGMMRDMAGMQNQLKREENISRQMQQLTVNQPGFNMSSVNTAFGSMTLDRQPDMEVPPNISYTDYMIERVSMEDSSGYNFNPKSLNTKNTPSIFPASSSNEIKNSYNSNKNNNNNNSCYYCR